VVPRRPAQRPAAAASAAAAVVATTLREVFGVLDPADLSRS
jgi:hypothetical protein